MFLTICRFAVVAANLHRITAQAIRYGIHLHQIHLARRGTVFRNLGKHSVHVHSLQLVFRRIPILCEVGLHIGIRDDVEGIDTEIERPHVLVVDQTEGAIETGRQMVVQRDHIVALRIAGYRHSIRQFECQLLGVGCDAHENWQLRLDRIRIHNRHVETRRTVPNQLNGVNWLLRLLATARAQEHGGHKSHKDE